MFCPICKSEYEPGIGRCPDDNAELVPQLITNEDSSEAKFVPLHRFGSPAEAEMVNDMLQQNGIRSVMQGASADAFSALFSATSPGAAVLVDERDLDRAHEVYSSFFGADTTPLTGGTFESDEDS